MLVYVDGKNGVDSVDTCVRAFLLLGHGHLIGENTPVVRVIATQ